MMGTKRFWIALAVMMWLPIGNSLEAFGLENELKVQLTWGHSSADLTFFSIGLHSEGVAISDFKSVGLETGEGREDGFWKTSAGGGDIDGVAFTIVYSPTTVRINDKLHPFWKYLLDHGDSDTIRRLESDPALRIDSRTIMVQTNREGTTGFSLTLDQLLSNKSFWIPSLDLYLTTGDPPVSFNNHQQESALWKGRRILDRIAVEPESSYERFTALWEDMGRPEYIHPNQPVPGHIVGLTWDSVLYKFGVDRGAGVWNDYGNPDRFRFRFDFGDLNDDLKQSWKWQRLADGLPVINTLIEKDSLNYEVEQFAFPLHGAPAERRGDIPMVLLQKVNVLNKDHEEKTVRLTINHQRKLSSTKSPQLIPEHRRDSVLFLDDVNHNTLFSVQGEGFNVEHCESKSVNKEDLNGFEIILSFSLKPDEARELIVKLPSPMVLPDDRDTLLAMDYEDARRKTIQFWEDYLACGAQLQVPEKAVNDLFRANLWHALRLPRRHGGAESDVRIDLPYSNFAYDQTGIPWPVNQAVYVDYMLYDLRGYHDISVEELLAMFRANQESNGHISGFANWGVYTPAMIYSVAQNFLLSQDRDAFERLLPYTLKAVDWCLNEIQQASKRFDSTKGLIRSPLNDLTGDGVWAFTQAYLYAGLDMLGKALERIDHPRAQECLSAARQFQESIMNAFGTASMQSPLVQLRDHTWIPYVPCELLTPRRLLEQWYPADVDTGATHLIRLKAVPCDGLLADSLLNDHEDNLFYKGWGAANEPVYNPQAAAYLLRDDPKAVIRAFYSTMASAFSHSVFEPVEHRWFWGQYFGPPSTDGAWFELYRNMLIHERDDDSLILLSAAPRKWFENGKKIVVQNAPTYYGPLSFSVTSHANTGRLIAEIDKPDAYLLKTLLIRFRHPSAKPIHAVQVNGVDWNHFDVQKEWIVIENPDREHYSVIVEY